MRTVKFGVLALVVASAALGGSSLYVPTPSYTYEANYPVFPGTPYEKDAKISINRKLHFYFAGGQVDPKNPKKIIVDDEMLLKEYTPQLIAQAKQQASQETWKQAQKEKMTTSQKYLDKVYAEILSKKMAVLPYKPVDCHVVAKNMVEHMITYRVEVTKSKSNSDGESRRLQRREDHLDSALVAKQLGKITIMKGEPAYQCKAGKVQGLYGRCADLVITTRPRVAASGPFKGKQAVIFDPTACGQFAEEMDFNSCELMMQIQGCGLRYVQKSWGAHSSNAATRGLSDALEAFKDDELRLLQDGHELLTDPDDDKPAAQAAEAPASNGVPNDFYNSFVKPSKTAE